MVRQTRRWRAKQQPRKHTNRDIASATPKIGGRRNDLSISQAASDLAILKHLFMPHRTGMTASRAWLTEPAIVAFAWLDESMGNREYQTCCKIAGAAIAVPRKSWWKGSSLASHE